jgi:hypothetical protein
MTDTTITYTDRSGQSVTVLPEDYSFWYDGDLTDEQGNYLMEIESKVNQLTGYLRDVEKYATRGLTFMAAGQEPGYGSDIFGQCVRDAERVNTELKTMTPLHRHLGIPTAKLQATYTKAANR